MVPLVLVFIGMAADTSDVPWLEDLAMIPIWPVFWPLFIFAPLFPPHPDCPSCMRAGPVLLTAVCDFLIYGALTYAVLKGLVEGVVERYAISSEVTELKL